jgi:cellulose synthase operon protein C
MRRHPLLLALVLSATLAGCGEINVRPAADIHVVTSPPSTEVDALVERFFGEGAQAPELEAELRSALLKYPTSGALHEVAAYSAVLAANDHAAWEHFLLAAADTHNPDAALDIMELSRMNRTRSETLATVDALERIAKQNPDVEVRARAHSARGGFLRALGHRDEAEGDLAALGFVRTMKVIGAFDNEDGKGLAEAYPPESKVDLSTEVPGTTVAIRWRTAETILGFASVPLQDLVYPNQGAVAYAVFWVRVPAATEATLRISTEVPVAAWVDHGEVAREDRVQHWGLDNVTAPVTLRAGWNEVLVKSAVKSGAWHLAARITDRDGNAIPNLTTTVEPQPTAPRAPPPKASATAKRDTGHRADFAAARRLVLSGLHQPGLGAFEKELASSPSNAVLRYFTADAAERDRQLERALDLLASGASDKNSPLGFLQARASIYREKDLWTQAQRDLARVIAECPQARVARMDMADLLAKRTWHSDRVALLLDVVRRWPDSAWAFSSLGGAFEAQGYPGKAEQAYKKAVALDPSYASALRALRRLAETRRDTSAVEATFDRLAAADPLDVSDQLAHAEFERTRARAADAKALLMVLVARSPDHPTPFVRLAQMAEERGDTPKAVAFYQMAQDRDPRDSWLAERLQFLKPPTEDALSPYVATDEDVEHAVHRATAKGDAASHVETLLSDTATLLNSDGSVRLVVTQVLRALTQRGRDELVRLGLPSGQVRVLKAYAETTDGRRQDASSVEKTSVRFRNLEVGSTVVLQFASYPRRTGALADDYFQDYGFGTLGRHIDRMRWVIVASKNKAMQVDADARVKHTVTEASPWVVHQFVRDDVAAIPGEQSMVPIADLVAHVVVTTVPTWDSYIRWEKAILDESFPADPAIDALAAKLTTGATTPRDKLAKLFAFVAEEVRYQQEYESILAGWQPHRSSVVLERKYGDCKDKATLLIALARAVSVKVNFVVLATHGLGHPTHSVVLPHFNHAIAYIPVQPGVEEPFFLDPTVDALDLWNLREDDQGSAGLVLDPTTGTWNWIDIPYQAPNFQDTRWKAELDVASPEKVTAKSHIEYRGSTASSLRTALRNADQSRQVYDVVATSQFPAAKVLTASSPDHESLVHPLAIDEELDLAASVRHEGDHYRLTFPFHADSAKTRLNERQTPLDLGPLESSESEIVVRMSKDVRLVEKPAPVEVVDPCFRVRRTVTGDATTVTLKEEFEQTCTRVSVEDYPRFRAALDRARSLLDAAVVFDKAQGKPAGERASKK